MSEQLLFLWQQLPNLLIGFPGMRPGGLVLSLLLAVVAIACGFLLALLIGSGAESRGWLWRWLSRLYVETIRGLPLILLLVIVHQLIGGRLKLSPRLSAFITLTLYSSAYQAEIVRSGLRTVPQQLIETASLLGSRRWQIYLFVQIRYTLHVMLPAFVGEAISLFKDTSVVVVIGVAELMTVARIALGSDVTNAPYWVGVYLLVGFLYFCVAFGVSQWAQRWEKRTQTQDLVHSLANY